MPKPRSTTLTPKQLHNLLLKVLTLAAQAEGSAIPPNSRTIRALYVALQEIGEIVGEARSTVPLAVARDRKGQVNETFRSKHFVQIELYENLRRICSNYKRSKGHGSRQLNALASAIAAAFATAGRAVTEADSLVIAGLVHSKKMEKPSVMADEILLMRGENRSRTNQYLGQLMPKAARTRSRLQEVQGEVHAVREFLTCLQVPKERVGVWADMILAARAGPGELAYVSPAKAAQHATHRASAGLGPLPSGSRHYSLREACRPWPTGVEDAYWRAEVEED